jgi:hypothetical protein
MWRSMRTLMITTLFIPHHTTSPLFYLSRWLTRHNRLSALADEFGFLLVVDDTIGNFANVDLLQSEGKVDL